MTAPAAQPAPAVPQTTRVRVFVDYWNFQLTLNEREAAARHLADFRFGVDWKKLGPWLAKKACGAVGVANHAFDGVIIYTSYNPATAEGKKFKNWVMTWLDRHLAFRCIVASASRARRSSVRRVTSRSLFARTAAAGRPSFPRLRRA